jgi:serine/threonine-protein kinase
VSGKRAPRLGLGDVIDGKYQLVDLVDEGASHVVYRAEHIGIQRQVEVKMLATHLPPGGPDAAALFRESRAAGSVAHRNVQSVVDSGVDDDGRPFVVYEALQGQTIAELVAAHPAGLPEERVASLLLELLEGLLAIHRGGVVHRNLRPRTVWIVPVRGGGEIVKIGGLEQAAFLAEGTSPPLVAGGASSSPFVAPELRFTELEPDTRVDVYSAGVLMRLLLTGQPEPGVPVGDTARRAIERATAHEPDDRFVDAEAFQNAVSLLLPSTGRPARDEQPTPSDPLVADLQYLKLRRSTWSGEQTAPRGEARVELLVMLLAIEGIWRTLGQSAWPRLVARVPEVEALLPGSAHVQQHLKTGVPVELASRILAAADELAGRGDLGFVAQLGDVVAQRGLRKLLAGVPDVLTPPAAAGLLDELWPAITRQGRVANLERGSRRARLIVRDQVQPSLELCALVAGVLRGTMTMSGARGVVVQTAACQALGDSACAFAIVWE